MNSLSVVVMIMASIIIGYYLTMTIILRKNKTDNRNKMYQALLMGFWMGLIELGMVGFMTTWNSTFTFIAILLVVGIAAFTYMIYNQVGINENQFMLSMIEHHQMAIDMTMSTKNNFTTRELIEIGNNITNSQEQEINQMRNILRKKGVPDDLGALFY